MKIKAKLALVLFLLIGLFACQEIDLTEESLKQSEELIELTKEELVSITFDGKKEIDEAQALKVAEEFQNHIIINNRTRLLTDEPRFTIKTKYYVESGNLVSSTRTVNACENTQVPVYEVNIQNGDVQGLIIVSGSRDFPVVLAYIPKVRNSEELEKSGASYLINLTKQGLLIDINRYKSISDSLKTGTLNKICNKLGIKRDKITENVIEKYTCLKETNGSITRVRPTTMPINVLGGVFPVVTTAWDQGEPYNTKLEKGNVYGEYTYVQAGCAVIAISQLLAFAEQPLSVDGVGSINWPYLKQNSKIYSSDPSDKINMIASLIKQVYRDTNTSPSVENGIVVGSGTVPTNTVNYIKNHLYCGDYQSYNPAVIKNSLNGFLPVLIRGEGHAFILDGYLMTKKKTKNLVDNQDMYWHANLGWGDSSSGYYKLDPDESVDFETWAGHTFHTENLMIVPYIGRKN